MERPIPFNGPMVRAILEGRKTQTRRIVKPQPTKERGLVFEGMALGNFGIKSDREIRCPYGQPGDQLWVRETFGHNGCLNCPVHYRANEPDWKDNSLNPSARWYPPIHMPRWASRITLEITGIRVELLQDISEKGAIAEGLRDDNGAWSIELANGIGISRCVDPRRTYEDLWESINGYGSWDVNPWVWVVEFRQSI